VSTDHSPDFDKELPKPLQDNHVDPSAGEGFRLIVAFRKIKSPAERRAVIELAERLGK
jgi:hypothetical protein